MKRLTLIRHAKSSWKDPDLEDFDRPLNKRGKESAPAMGQRLAQREFHPDMMVTSPAQRALETARIIAGQIDWPPEKLVLVPQIYDADIETLLEVVRGLDNRWKHVVLFGHNPGFTDFGNWLAAAGIDNIPTCGVLDLELNIDSWSQAGRSTGRVLEFDYPKRG